MDAVPFGRYLLLEKLAEGGMAMVYRAVLRETDGFEKQVALKRMLKELSTDEDFVTRFVDEARIVSTLSHSNIVQVFDFGQVEGEYFLAMELLDGPDLGTLLERCAEHQCPLTPAEAIYIAAEMARGLGAAHRRTGPQGTLTPIVHRDISPQNVLLSRAGEVKVTDFGIAKAAEKALKTRTGVIMGKCRYMAPEQASGQRVDARTDVFSAGCVLFEMLAGRPLFDGETVEEVFYQLLRAPIPRLDQIIPAVPPTLTEVIARCVARPMAERYADGAALARELETLLHRACPDFSRDQLISTIHKLVPPAPRRPVWEGAATVRPESLEDSDELGSADTQLPDTSRADVVIDAPPPSAVLDAAPSAADPPAAVERVPPAAEQVLDLQDRVFEQTPSLGTLRLQRPWASRLFIAALGGLLAGALGGVLFGGDAAEALALRQVDPGEVLEHEGWSLRLVQARQVAHTDGARLMVRMEAQAPPGADPATAAEACYLSTDGVLAPPLYRIAAAGPPGAGRLITLVFRAAAAKAQAELVVALSGTSPLRLPLSVETPEP